MIYSLGYLRNLSFREGLDEKTGNNKNSKKDKLKKSKMEDDLSSAEDNDETDETDAVTDDEPDKAPDHDKSMNDKDKNNKPKISASEAVGIVAIEKSDTVPACPSGQHFDGEKGTCITKSSFTNLGDTAAPLDGKPTMNYKGTVENAFNSLEEILGSDGMNKMSADTAKLADKQDQLIEAMNKMGPMMETAQTMMNTLKGFDIGNLLGASK